MIGNTVAVWRKREPKVTRVSIGIMVMSVNHCSQYPTPIFTRFRAGSSVNRVGGKIEWEMGDPLKKFQVPWVSP